MGSKRGVEAFDLAATVEKSLGRQWRVPQLSARNGAPAVLSTDSTASYSVTHLSIIPPMQPFAKSGRAAGRINDFSNYSVVNVEAAFTSILMPGPIVLVRVTRRR